MRVAQVAAMVFAGLCSLACANRIDNQVKNPGASAASTYGTFFVLQGNSSGNALLDQELRTEIERELTVKGMLLTSPEEAEAVVVVHSTTRAKNSRSALYEGWGGWSWRRTGAGEAAARESFPPGTAVVDMFDAWTKRLVWQGSTGTEPEVESERPLAKLAARLFDDFPLASYRNGLQGGPAGQGHGRRDEHVRLFFSTTPAVLVLITGEPKYEPIDATPLQRISNTNDFIVRDSAGLHYLKCADTWMEADDLFGFWSEAGAAPEGAEIALRQMSNAALPDPSACSAASGPIPTIYISTTPAELVVTDGTPQYAPIEGSGLLFLKNTRATVFREATDQELYVRLPRGWFRAWTTDGPWEQIGEDQLPASLAWMRRQPPDNRLKAR